MKIPLTIILLNVLIDIGTSFTIERNETSKREKIFGGQFVSINEAPYHVYLLFNKHYMCGGSLITFRHVLTAAHCITSKAEHPHLSLEVVAGTDSLQSTGVKRSAKSIFIHPKYTSGSFDIGLILLTAPFPASNFISIVPLPSKWTNQGARVKITGFGRFTHEYEEISSKLRKLMAFVSDCREWISAEDWSGGDICVVSQMGQGVCNGDSGSPLINDIGEVVGVASRVYECGQGGPDIYSYVYFYLKYINTIIKATSHEENSNNWNEKNNGDNPNDEVQNRDGVNNDKDGTLIPDNDWKSSDKWIPDNGWNGNDNWIPDNDWKGSDKWIPDNGNSWNGNSNENNHHWDSNNRWIPIDDWQGNNWIKNSDIK